MNDHAKHIVSVFVLRVCWPQFILYICIYMYMTEENMFFNGIIFINYIRFIVDDLLLKFNFIELFSEHTLELFIYWLFLTKEHTSFKFKLFCLLRLAEWKLSHSISWQIKHFKYSCVSRKQLKLKKNAHDQCKCK